MHETPPVITRLERQLELFRRLEAIAERQSDLIDEGRTPELLAIIAERQTLVDEIVRVGKAIETDLSLARPDAQVNQLLEQVGQIATRVQQRDQNDHRRLEIDRDRLSGEMAGVGRGRHAVAAYSNRTREPTTRFKDTEA